MALFDMFKSKAENAIKKSVNSAVTQGFNKATSAVSNLGNKKEKIVFSSLPSSFEEFASLPQAALSTPFETAAMTVLAFCYYPQNKDLALQMVNYLRGPRPLSGEIYPLLRTDSVTVITFPVHILKAQLLQMIILLLSPIQ